jgi:hypothetical protein
MYKKDEFRHRHYTLYKINLKEINDINMKCKMIIFLEVNIRENLYKLGKSNDLLI